MWNWSCGCISSTPSWKDKNKANDYVDKDQCSTSSFHGTSPSEKWLMKFYLPKGRFTSPNFQQVAIMFWELINITMFTKHFLPPTDQTCPIINGSTAPQYRSPNQFRYRGTYHWAERDATRTPTKADVNYWMVGMDTSRMDFSLNIGLLYGQSHFQNS